MQPHVHLRRIPHQLRRAAQLRGQLLARREAAVDLEELQQIDDGGPPVQLLRVRRRALLQLRDDIDERDRPGRWRCGRQSLTWARGRGAGGEAGAAAAAVPPRPRVSKMVLKNPMVLSCDGGRDRGTRPKGGDGPRVTCSLGQIAGTLVDREVVVE